jgi:hypothetical protein
MQYMCKQCLAVAELPPDSDPHASTWCGCCDQDHHHAENARTCTPEVNHPGQLCWNPPGQPIRPDGCGVCRPIIHFGVAGTHLVPGFAGQVPGVN